MKPTGFPTLDNDLTWIRDHLTDLWEARHWSNRPRWHEHQDTATARETKDAEARAEKAWSTDWNAKYAPGYTKAPYRVEIADLHQEACTKLAAWRAMLDPADPDDALELPDLEHLMEAAARLRDKIRGALGLIDDGQVLKGVCPFCLGVGPDTPAGGAHTLTFRRVPRPAAFPVRKDDPTDDGTEIVVRCESGTCTPFDSECSLFIHGMPAWPWPEWGWLTQRMAHINDGIRKTA